MKVSLGGSASIITITVGISRLSVFRRLSDER
jgi:hypothetical protein